MANMTIQHKVVQLDGHLELPELRFPHEFVKYHATRPEEVASRIADATIIIATATRLSHAMLTTSAPKLQLISSLGAGVDTIDAAGVRERGLTLTNTPAQNTDTVTEHAFALYFAVKRRIPRLHEYTMGSQAWPGKGLSVLEFDSAPRITKEETLGIVGYGALGKCVEKMAKALGMSVLIAERKGAASARPGRHPFETVLRESTVLVLLCPLDATTHNMIDAAELTLMRSDAILVNVGRGGVVNEAALADALREHRLGGSGVDVFETEPATKETCPLLDPSIPNLVVTPHLAWFSNAAIEGTKKTVRETIEAFVAGRPINVVIGKGRSDLEVNSVGGKAAV